ncbi:hypothetical protein Dimus_028882 [Dionaea muscipula]
MVVSVASPPSSAAVASPPSSAAVVSPVTEPSKSSLPQLSGTFYRSPAPGEPPIVKVGDKVKFRCCVSLSQ